MINVLTSHNHIWSPEQVAIDIVQEYQQKGHVMINLNQEGPCADAIGLYKLLDYLCKKMNIKKSNITIVTVNFEETHTEYVILKKSQHWINSTVSAFKSLNFVLNKKIDQNLFGCLYYIPSWDRLCLLSYINRTKNKSLLRSGGTFIAHKDNTYYLNTVVDYCPNELFNIVDYLKTDPVAVFIDELSKPVTPLSCMRVTECYNDFFVDIVAETYSNGLCFFITEKTLRPMLTLTPFIIHGPKGYLSTLKSDYGIKTFEQWWDESYDDYQNYERITKIYKVIDYLDSLSMSDREAMYKDMQPILLHNYQTLINI